MNGRGLTGIRTSEVETEVICGPMSKLRDILNAGLCAGISGTREFRNSHFYREVLQQLDGGPPTRQIGNGVSRM